MSRSRINCRICPEPRCTLPSACGHDRSRISRRSSSSIQHIVQLMLENRSFDHMLGFLYPNKTGPNGAAIRGTARHRVQQRRQWQCRPGLPDRCRPPPAPISCPARTRAKATPTPTRSCSARGKAPTPPVATNSGFVTNFAAAITLRPAIHRTAGRGHRRRRTSWGSSRRRRCRSCPAWRRGSPSATTGTAQCRPRRSRTGRSPARAPARDT